MRMVQKRPSSASARYAPSSGVMYTCDGRGPTGTQVQAQHTRALAHAAVDWAPGGGLLQRPPCKQQACYPQAHERALPTQRGAHVSRPRTVAFHTCSSWLAVSAG
jgi:hypothetical protein